MYRRPRADRRIGLLRVLSGTCAVTLLVGSAAVVSSARYAAPEVRSVGQPADTSVQSLRVPAAAPATPAPTAPAAPAPRRRTAPEGQPTPEGEPTPDGSPTPAPPPAPESHDHDHAEEAPAAGRRVVAQLNAPETQAYSLLGVTWPLAMHAEDITVEVRTHGARGWSDWQELHVDPSHGPQGDPEGVRAGTEPHWVGASRGVQVRLEGPTGMNPADVRVELVDPGETAAAPAPMAYTTTHLSPFPSIITRRQWGANESLGDSCWDPIADTIRAVFVHHTVGSNTYTREESDNLVRGIHAYHTQSQGWCDIGYNFLVDRFGQIFEGRAGGIWLPVRGSHAGDVNHGTTGISLMGNFQNVGPTAAMQDALVRLIAWRLETYYRDPRGTVVLAGDRYSTISGHRDAMSTACPGEHVYRLLPEIRDRVAAQVGAWRSAIFWRWHQLGGEVGYLGSPFIGERWSHGGRLADFENGSIYWSSATGPHEVLGAIRGAYRQAGATGSALGFPVTGELSAGIDGARFNSFQRGGVYWSRATGAHTVLAGINARYHHVGGAVGIGLPTADEADAAVTGGRVSTFQRGDIYWSRETGPHAIYGAIRAHFNTLGGPPRLGLPTAEEADAGRDGGRVSTFQGGDIYSSRATGPRAVFGAILATYRRAGGASSDLGLPKGPEMTGPDGRRQQEFQGGFIYWNPLTRRASITYGDSSS